MTLKPDAPSEQDLKAAEELGDGWYLNDAQCPHFKRLSVMKCNLCLIARIAQDRASLRADLQREREQAVRQALEKWGGHAMNCGRYWRGNCTCGLSAALGVQPATTEGKP